MTTGAPGPIVPFPLQMPRDPFVWEVQVRREVLEAVTRVVEAALDAGAGGAELKIEAQGDAPRFGEQG